MDCIITALYTDDYYEIRHVAPVIISIKHNGNVCDVSLEYYKSHIHMVLLGTTFLDVYVSKNMPVI